MTDRSTLAVPSRRRLFVLAVSLAVVAAMVGVGLYIASPGGGPPPGPVSTPAPTSPAAVARLHAIQHLLDERSTAIVHRDRAAFLASIDPLAGRFRRGQSRMFAHLAPVPVASWSYGMTASARRLPPDAARYAAPVWAPSYFVLHYRLRRFDPKPTTLRQYPTFVERDGRWYLASLADYAARGKVSATDIWDYGPVKVMRRPGVLVLGAPSRATTMVEVAHQVHAAIEQVTAVWGRHWARRAVVLVPRSVRDMARIDDYHGDLTKLTALTSSEVSTAAGDPAPVGDRITINPVNWPRLSAVGAAVVIRHELTHVATRAATSTQTPTWLTEGFADYVGFLDAPVSVALAASELRSQVRAGRAPRSLPDRAGFRSTNPNLAVSYESAWLACRYIAEHFGQRTLVRFYRSVGTSQRPPKAAVASALHRLLHLDLDGFVGRWRDYVIAELA